jgi:DNA polymerase-1
MDEEVLQGIDHPFVQKLLRLSKYEKALGTFLKGIEQEIVGDRLHPSFSLHTARSFRSSSDSPNFQNFPIRDKEIAKIIRSLFIASPKSVLVENDFKGIEVALSAAYHKDPVFIDYITSPGKDMHKDMAAQLYCLKTDEVNKDIRYAAKNCFVFPQFYGDFYISCARALWNAIERLKLKGPDGKPLYRHLKRQGIFELGELDPEQEARDGSFEAHVQEVEKDFWNRRFKVYGRWKRDWYDQYLKSGYFDILTGFRIEGFFSRNQAVNLPVQGAAFHCLLWSLIQINRRMRKEKMRSLIVGQIHDSLIGDVRVDELRDYLQLVEEVTTRRLPQHWPWLVVSPQIEYEIAPLGKSWFEKRECKFAKGLFQHPAKPTLKTSNAKSFLRALSHE